MKEGFRYYFISMIAHRATAFKFYDLAADFKRQQRHNGSVWLKQWSHTSFLRIAGSLLVPYWHSNVAGTTL